MISRFSTVFSFEFLEISLENSRELGLTIIENESDPELGYFTFSGEKMNVELFKSFLRGETFI